MAASRFGEYAARQRSDANHDKWGTIRRGISRSTIPLLRQERIAYDDLARSLDSGEDVQLVDGLSYPNNSSWGPGNLLPRRRRLGVEQSTTSSSSARAADDPGEGREARGSGIALNQIRVGCSLQPSIGMAAT